MPNAKIYVDQTVWIRRDEIVALLPRLPDLLCLRLSVGPAACQLAVLPVRGLPDQPLINVELHILPAPDRTSELLTSLAAAIRQLLAGAMAGKMTGKIAVRIATLDPETYVALKSWRILPAAGCGYPCGISRPVGVLLSRGSPQ